MQYNLDSRFRVFRGLSEVDSADITNQVNLTKEIINFTFNRNLANINCPVKTDCKCMDYSTVACYFLSHRIRR